MKTFSINKLKKALHKNEQIVFSLIFGSARDGKLEKKDADIDIAVYLSTSPTADILAEIIGLCQDAVKFDNIDISILNTSDPILAFEAISGKLLTCRDDEKYASFFSLTCRQYEDEMIRINKHISYRNT